MKLFDKYITSVSLSNIDITHNLTIMFWIKMDENRITREFLCGKNPFNDFGIILEKSESNQISFYCGDSSRINNCHTKYYAYTGRLPYNKYTHVCFVRNNTSIVVYVNGILKRTYYHKMGDIVFTSDNFNIYKSIYPYVDNFTQQATFFKLYNNTISKEVLNQVVNNNNLEYYYEDKYSQLLYTYNLSGLHYRFTFNNITYIYIQNMFVKYTESLYNQFVKLNNIPIDTIKGLVDNAIYLDIDIDISGDTNIHNIVENIISWQFGMYQTTYPKQIETSTIGFWSKRECNFLNKYNGSGNTYIDTSGGIKYNYGSLQDGTGVYIKIIVDYYLKYETTTIALVSDCLESINIFIDFLNEMIYDNGGIPEYYPLQGYHFDNICLNDGAFINYLYSCDIILKSDIKNKIDINKINLLQTNYNKAIQCILGLQVTINNIKTIWAQQYDPITLLPTYARSFEKPSLCSLESAQLLIYLMSISNPTDQIKESIKAGCEWYKSHSITNYSQEINNNIPVIIENTPNIRNLYSRYYSLDTEVPIFFDRDGVDYYLHTFNNLMTASTGGYTWLGCWGDYLLEVFEYWETFNIH